MEAISLAPADGLAHSRYRGGDRSAEVVEGNRRYMRLYMREWRRMRGAMVRAASPGETDDDREARLGAIACRLSLQRSARVVQPMHCRCCGDDLLAAELLAESDARYAGAVGRGNACAMCVAERVA